MKLNLEIKTINKATPRCCDVGDVSRASSIVSQFHFFPPTQSMRLFETFKAKANRTSATNTVFQSQANIISIELI